MAKYRASDQSNSLGRWIARPTGAAIAGAVAAMLAGLCPVPFSATRLSEIFLAVIMFSDARESLAQLFAATTLASLTAGGILGWAVWAIVRFVERSRLPLFMRILITLVAAPTSLAFSLVVPMVGVGMWDDYMASQPSDNALIRNFQQNRSSFERLNRILQNTPELSKIRADTAAPASENEESKAYRLRLQKLNIIYSVPGSAENDFCVRDNGWVDGPSDEEGYCYRTTSPANLCERLDGKEKSFVGNVSTNFFAYRRIEGNWYLYYRHSSGQ